MPRQPPVRHRIDDVAALPTQRSQARQHLRHKDRQVRREVLAMAAFESAPFPFLRIQLGTVARQSDHLQPGAPRGQGLPADLARMAGAIVQDQDHLPPGGHMPGLQRR